MNPIKLPLAMGKIWQTGLLSLVWQPVSEKENSEFKPVKFLLKINFLSGVSSWFNG